MPLTKERRDALKESDFAVPETRQLPMSDEVHTRMAWQMVDRTKGLLPEQRRRARSRILRRAKELGMDVSDWNIKAAPDANEPYPDKGALNEMDADYDEQVDFDENEDREMEKEQEEHEQREDELQGQAIRFSALAMEIPDQLANHPNQTPFTGVLTKIDEPSDNPLSGSDGKRVILPKDVAEKALPSLLGMCVDFTPNLDGHDAQSKIGLITAANIVGNEIHISGFFYGADFPSEVKRIQAEKAQLGFSYEAQAHLQSKNDDPLVIKDCVFTGAAVLYKDKAAYTTTSLKAKKTENFIMSDEMKKQFEDMQNKIADLEKKLAAGNISHMVKPHSDAIRASANAMCAAGMGMHAKQGHVAVLHSMADQMDADAAMGKMPHIFQNYDFLGASADKSMSKTEENTEIKKILEAMEGLNSKLLDLEKSKFAAASEPERKTLPPAIMKLLAKEGINGEDSKITSEQINKMLANSDLPISKRIQYKLDMQNKMA